MFRLITLRFERFAKILFILKPAVITTMHKRNECSVFCELGKTPNVGAVGVLREARWDNYFSPGLLIPSASKLINHRGFIALFNCTFNPNVAAVLVIFKSFPVTSYTARRSFRN